MILVNYVAFYIDDTIATSEYVLPDSATYINIQPSTK